MPAWKLKFAPFPPFNKRNNYCCFWFCHFNQNGVQIVNESTRVQGSYFESSEQIKNMSRNWAQATRTLPGAVRGGKRKSKRQVKTRQGTVGV